jgi:DNA-binding beta-propeller fold protein YncE
MKQILSLAVILFAANIVFAQHQLLKKWETDSTLKVPESVLFDGKNNVLYVSNIDGAPDGKDGVGSIGKVGLDGKIIMVDWVTGLNAPKGMALVKNTLWVADVDQMVAIDIKEGKIIKTIPVEGAGFLNDVAADGQGIVYVSDSKTKKVHKIEKDKVSLVLENLQGPNGLLVHDNDLYVLDNGTMNKVKKNELKQLASGLEGHTDGIEHVKGNEFIVSGWEGVIYYVDANGKKEKLLDTRAEKINSADIGYDPKNKIVYVPTFFKNSVVAYQLQ